MPNPISRRQLLARTGQVATFTFAANSILRQQPTAFAQNTLGANTRLGIGLIGCGQRGTQLLQHALQMHDTAFPIVCDVDAKRAASAADTITQAGKPKPVIVSDYRQVLDHAAVNGVIIATPNHWHAIQHLEACAAEKDVYLEAPISYNITEGQAMVFVTRKYRRVVQVGQQFRSSNRFHEAANRVQTRQLGRIAQTRTWTFAKTPPIPQQPDRTPPASLDYDRWIGPARPRPYNPARVQHHFAEWWDFGGGKVCQWNVHLQDVIHAAMRVTVPKSVTALGGNFGLRDFRETPDTLEVLFEYENVHGPFMHVYSLRLSNAHATWGPDLPAPNGRTPTGHPLHYGTQFHGDHASLFVDHDRLHTFASDQPPLPPNPPTPPEATSQPVGSDRLTQAHLANFLDCMVTRAEPKAPIEAGHFSLLPCHLANIAYRLGRKIYFDANRQHCFRDPDHKSPDTEADAMMIRAYRKPYTFPNV